MRCTRLPVSCPWLVADTPGQQASEEGALDEQPTRQTHRAFMLHLANRTTTNDKQTCTQRGNEREDQANNQTSGKQATKLGSVNENGSIHPSRLLLVTGGNALGTGWHKKKPWADKQQQKGTTRDKRHFEGIAQGGRLCVAFAPSHSGTNTAFKLQRSKRKGQLVRCHG